MSIFSTNFRKVINGSLGFMKETVVTNTLQPLLSAINRYRSYLSTSRGPQDSVIAALTCDSNLIHDIFVEEELIEFDAADPIITEVDSELANTVIQGLADGCTNGGFDKTTGGVTLSDGNGRIYNIIDQRNSNAILDDRYEVLFSSTYMVSNISEAILYYDRVSGKYYLNNLIRTANYVGNNPERVMPTQLCDIFHSMEIMTRGIVTSNGSISDSINTVAKAVGYQAAFHPNTIYNKIKQLCVFMGSGLTRRTIMDQAALLWSLINDRYPLVNGKGSYVPIWTVVKDNIESSELNSVILKTCNALLSSSGLSVAISTLHEECIQSKYVSVRQFGSNIASAYSTGGISGVSGMILHYARSLTSLEEDDGFFHLTDNEVLIPKVFLAGVLQTIVTVIKSTVVLIASIFSRILGVAIALVSGIIDTIKSAKTASVNATVVSDETTVLPITPYGCFQCTLSKGALMSMIGNPDVKSILAQGPRLCYVVIPGGYLLFGPANSNGFNGDPTAYNCEFHPALISDGDTCGYLRDLMTSEGLVSFVATTWGVLAEFGLIEPRLYLSYHPGGKANFAKLIAQRWNSHITGYIFKNSNTVTPGTLSDVEDSKAISIIERNIAIASLYLSCFLPGDENDLMNQNGRFRLFFDQNMPSYGVNDRVVEPIGSQNHASDFQSYKNSAGPWEVLLCRSGTPDTRYPVVVGEDQYDLILNATHKHSSASKMDWTRMVLNNVNNTNNSVSGPYQYGSAQATAIISILNGKQYFNELTTFDTRLESCIIVPKYDSSSFWNSIVLIMTVTTVVAAIALTVAVSAKMRIAHKQADNQAKIYTAHDNYAKDPSDANYKTFKKAVLKNNLWATFIGGSKFDTVSYWNGATNDDSGSTTGTAKNAIFTGGVLSSDQRDSRADNISSDESSPDLNFTSLSSIKKLISGAS